MVLRQKKILFRRIALLYTVLAIIYFTQGGCATYAVKSKLNEVSSPSNEQVNKESCKLKKYEQDAEIEGNTYYIYYGYNLLYGKNRMAYLLVQKGYESYEFSRKDIITENISKYKLVPTAFTSNYAIVQPPNYIEINGYSFLSHFVVDPEVTWIKRSYVEYAMWNCMYVLSVPYDVLTFPFVAIHVMTTPW